MNQSSASHPSASPATAKLNPKHTREVLIEFANRNCMVTIPLGHPLVLGGAELGLSLIRSGSGDDAVYRGTLTGPLRRKLVLTGWECQLLDDESRCVAHGAIGPTGAIEIPLDAEELDARPDIHINFATSPKPGGDGVDTVEPQATQQPNRLAAAPTRLTARGRGHGDNVRAGADSGGQARPSHADDTIDRSGQKDPVDVRSRVTRVASDFPVGLVLMVVSKRESSEEIGRRFVHTTPVEDVAGVQCRTLVRSALEVFSDKDLSDAQCYLIPASLGPQQPGESIAPARFFDVEKVRAYLASPCAHLHPYVRQDIEEYVSKLDAPKPTERDGRDG